MMEPLAHSENKGVRAQTYREHIENVSDFAARCAERAACFYRGEREKFIDWVEAAACFHDLGKLDASNQRVLQFGMRKHLPIHHQDAGVAELWRVGRKESGVLVASHHAGLFSKDHEKPPNKQRPFRDESPLKGLGESTVAEYVDHNIEAYLTSHVNVGLRKASDQTSQQLHNCGFTRRLALSCLVDADHGDTARHYGGESDTPVIPTRWAERAAALQRYVEGLPAGKTQQERKRNRLRRRLYDTCQDAPVDPPIRSCEAPVGSGKTTAVMAHLLRAAAERKPPLRHIFVVLPYTNIITQCVEVYRKALVLEGERPEDVVAEHHHRADFADLELRQLATLWKAPIIVTTAVQFFETLGSSHPSRLRKLHELPGSAVFVDEMHAAIPSHLWPQVWRWVQTWTQQWGGHLVLASGSLTRFWELDEYRTVISQGNDHSIAKVPDLVADDGFRGQLHAAEEHRVCFQRRDNKAALNCDELIEFVVDRPGPRLLIVNTVQTAAVIAQKMRQAERDVLHLSTALAPAHRDSIVERVKLRLRDRIEDWTLVATSCVEAGMDFSFRTGFRERASTASLIQIAGRVNRGNENPDAAEVWDIMLRDNQFRDNPAVTVSRQALDRFALNQLNKSPSADLVTRAMRQEWTCGSDSRANELIHAEESMEYPSVSDKCRVIEGDTRTVVIDPALADAIGRGKRVSKTELLNYSVQMWITRIEGLDLKPLRPPVNRSGETALYAWGYEYDTDFLGYMAGVLRLEQFLNDGGGVI